MWRADQRKRLRLSLFPFGPSLVLRVGTAFFLPYEDDLLSSALPAQGSDLHGLVPEPVVASTDNSLVG